MTGAFFTEYLTDDGNDRQNFNNMLNFGGVYDITFYDKNDNELLEVNNIFNSCEI